MSTRCDVWRERGLDVHRATDSVELKSRAMNDEKLQPVVIRTCVLVTLKLTNRVAYYIVKRG